MNELFSKYFQIIFHPFKYHLELKSYRNAMNPYGASQLSFIEYVLISWPFVIVNSLYVLLGMFIFSFLGNDMDQGLLLDYSLKFKSISVLHLLIVTSLFPLFAYIYTSFWRALIKFSSKLFSKNDELEEQAVKDVSNGVQGGNFFLLIPVFGPTVRFFSSLVYLYSGLRKNLSFTKIQSLFVILSPLLIIFMLIFIWGASLTFFIFSLI